MIDSEVTVCLCTWNAAQFVGGALKSLMAQTHEGMRVLIADDASGDATLEQCQQLIGNDQRFSLEKRPHNLGWCRNYAALLLQVRTPYVCFAFHDDHLDPQYIGTLVAALATTPQAVLAYSDLGFGINAFVPLSGNCQCLDQVANMGRRLRLLIQMRGSWWIPFRGVMRTEAALRCVDCLDLSPKESFSADWIWLIRLAMEGMFLRIPQQLVIKNWLESGVTVSSSWHFRDEVRLRQRCLSELARQRPAGWRWLSLLTLMEIGLLPLRRLSRHGRATLLQVKIGRPRTKASC
jgi:glycosyltransferase involved in cell wall biosynthesis